MKSVKYEENEIKLRRLENVLNDLQELDEKKYVFVRNEISKLRNQIEVSKNAREKKMDADFDEFFVLERRTRNLLEQNSKVN